MPKGKLVRFKASAKQMASNRNIARIAAKVADRKMETKANVIKSQQLEIPYHHEGIVNFLELTPTEQGDGDNQRIGNSIRAQRIHLKLLLRNADDDTGVDGSIRVCVIKTKKLFVTADFNYLNPAFPNDGYAQKFDEDTIIVKYDKTHMLGTLQNGRGEWNPFRSLDLTFRGIGKVKYATDAIQLADVNPWYLIVYRVDNSGVASGRAAMVINSRMYYKDA